VRLWRIARRRHAALDGEGARLAGGRWSRPGASVVYTSTTLSLAALEILAHLDPEEAPADLVAIEIDLPDDVASESIAVDDLPAGWNRTLEHPACIAGGTRWIGEGRTVALSVPSALVPEERNVLLNPEHPDMARVHAARHRAFAFDARLLR
jgi:RES domain-containing protein